MFCLYLIRGIQSSLKSQPILIQARHIGNAVWSVSNINSINASRLSGIRCPDISVSLKNLGNLQHISKMPFIYKVQSSPLQKAVRCLCSSSSNSSDEGKLIYTGSLATAIRGVKFFSYSSSMFSMIVMPQVLLKTGFGTDSLALQVAFCTFIGFFTFATPILLHLLTKGYVVRLYHNHETDTYTAVTYSFLLLEKKTVFHQSEVSVPDVSKMFTSFYAKKRSMLVNPMLFSLPHDYNHLMGYDKPFTFDMDMLDEPDRSKRD